MSAVKHDWRELRDRDFEFIRELIRERVGISIGAGKKSMVQGRLVRRVRKLKLESIDDYLEYLRNGNAAELDELTNALTTNLTSFFREAHHFETVARLIAEHDAAKEPRLRIWSAACSTTAKSHHSIALTVRDHVGERANWDIKILATDVDSDVLETAKRGEYDRDAVKGLGPHHLRHFAENRDKSRVRASGALKDLISFRRLNLLDAWPMRGPFDAIFCRNVLIYFSAELQREIVDRFVRYLRPNGYLLLGHSESLAGQHPKLMALGRTVFRRAGR